MQRLNRHRQILQKAMKHFQRKMEESMIGAMHLLFVRMILTLF